MTSEREFYRRLTLLATTESRGLVRVGNLAHVWHSFRIAVALVTVAAGVGLGILWGWPGGFVVASLALVAAFDAVVRRRHPGLPIHPVLLDVTLIGVAMLVVRLEPAGVVPPLLYMLGIPLLLLSFRQAIPAMFYAIAWSAVAFAGVSPMSPNVDVVPELVTVISAVIFGGHTLALLAVVAFELEREHRARELRLAYQHSLAQCGVTLLTVGDEDAIDKALQVLAKVTQGQQIFVDRNLEDPTLGLCAKVTNEVIRPGFEDVVDPEMWVEEGSDVVSTTVVAYADFPSSYKALSAGKPSLVITSELEGSERALYVEDGCKSELNVPIFIGSEWVGSIGVSDYLIDRQWNPADVQVLETAAAMIGGFWERKSSYRQLEQHIRSKDAFLASISHEIRTPLTAVVGYASMMHADADRLDPDLAEQVSHVAEQATEVADIVEDLLVAARADIDALAVAEESVELRSQLRNVVDSRLQASSHQIKISGEDVLAWTDPARLRQIIRCLLSNAIRYGGEHVEIRVAQVDHIARISFIDDGPGVDDEDRDHIFEPFHRAHHRKGLTQSVGLGLYVARHLARIMNGDLIYTRSGGRTVFELTLPAPQASKFGTTSAPVDPTLVAEAMNAEW